MRNLSTGSIVYLSSLRAARPSIEQIHSHIHNCKRSLNIIKRSYLPVWAFHCLQHMGQLPILFYPIWGAGIWQSKAMLAIKDSFYGSIISSSKSSFCSARFLPSIGLQYCGEIVLSGMEEPPTDRLPLFYYSALPTILCIDNIDCCI